MWLWCYRIGTAFLDVGTWLYVTLLDQDLSVLYRVVYVAEQRECFHYLMDVIGKEQLSHGAVAVHRW